MKSCDGPSIPDRCGVMIVPTISWQTNSSYDCNRQMRGCLPESLTLVVQNCRMNTSRLAQQRGLRLKCQPVRAVRLCRKSPPSCRFQHQRKTPDCEQIRRFFSESCMKLGGAHPSHGYEAGQHDAEGQRYHPATEHTGGGAASIQVAEGDSRRRRAHRRDRPCMAVTPEVHVFQPVIVHGVWLGRVVRPSVQSPERCPVPGRDRSALSCVCVRIGGVDAAVEVEALVFLKLANRLPGQQSVPSTQAAEKSASVTPVGDKPTL